MSTSGTLTSYYVDSLILPESEELSAPRYTSGPGGLQHARQLTSLTDHTELGPCTFPTKAPVFSPSWGHVSTQFPGAVSSVYHHPYGHHQGPAPGDLEGRYMQSWLLEPISGSLPLTGLPTSHHYGIKPESLGARVDSALPGSHTALLLSDFTNGTVATASPVDKNTLPGQTANLNGEIEEKPALDPRAGRAQSALQLFRPEPSVRGQLHPAGAGSTHLARGQTLPDVPLDENIRSKQKAWTSDVLPIPDTGAGERIPL
ncbi:homeobox protein Hox-A9-like isoform X2 [Oncorhynchus kisutch]|nr:homeobox protein Hox-A9-like isoform X2 [Oncorhynchus kisutch]